MKHIFDHSACLSAKQLKSYVSGSMVHEEAHAAEVHLLSCPLCSDAVEGLQESGSVEAIKAMDLFPKEFLKQHLGETNAEEYISAPTKPATAVTKEEEVTPREKSFKNIRIWRITSIAAALVIGIGALWLLRGVLKEKNTTTVAEAVNIEKTTPKPSSEFTAQVEEVDTATSGIDDVVDTIGIANSTDAPPEPNTQEEQLGKAQPEEQVATAAMAKDNAARELAKKADVADKKLVGKQEAEKKAKEQAAKLAAVEDRDKEVRARMGNSFDAANNNSKYYDNAADTKPTVEKAATEPPKEYTADELYEQKNYTAALAKYKKQMNSADREQRDEARLNISRCHIALGQNASAKAILQSLVDENSSQKRKAKKLLKKID
ncbi:MAG: tetratricopeptide repeat protein [Flavipsychrobacter sp.]